MSKFWINRPVVHDRLYADSGVIDPEAAAAEERESSMVTSVPAALEWANIDMTDPTQLDEVTRFLQKHYTDSDSHAQVHFTSDFLKWFFNYPREAFEMPSSWTPSRWAVGLRSSTGRKQLVGFHGAMPIHVRYHDVQMDVATSNFLCVHTKMRDKGVAPLLIKELSRVLGNFRVGGVFSITSPGPTSCVSFCTFSALNRPINLSVLEEAGLWAPKSKASRKSINRLYAVPTKTKPFRKMDLADVPLCMGLFTKDSMKYKVATVFRTEEEFSHHFCTMAESFVITDDGRVVDFFSYIPLLIRSGQHYPRVAQVLYITTIETSILESGKALIVAAAAQTDIVNSWGHFGMTAVENDLKFEHGNLKINYYNYNYLCPEVRPEEVSLVIV